MKRLLMVLGFILFAAGAAYSASLEELRALEAKAGEGDISAQVELGDMYFAESLQLYTKAAEQGNARAQYVLGRMYYNETNIAGGLFAKHYFGTGKADEALARSWYVKAAEQGLVEAQLVLGEISLGADPGPKQYEEAVKWFAMAAEQGDVAAQRRLGLMYKELFPKTNKMTDETPKTIKMDEALKWFGMAAEQGDTLSQLELGQLYLLENENALALKWFNTAAGQGNAWGWWWLAQMYNDGNGVESDKVRAWVLVNLSATDENIAAMLKNDQTMRAFYEKLDKSLSKAEREQALKQYEEERQEKAGAEVSGVVSKTITVPVNVEDLDAKAKAGDADAQFKLAEYYSGEGLKWYLKAATANSMEAQRKLGIIYNGESIVAADEKKALEWFTRAAPNGDVVSQRALGIAMLTGSFGVSKDSVTALKWLTAAAEQNDVESQWILSILYTGESEIAANPEMVLRWKTAAAIQGHPRAQYTLGEYYVTQQNYDEASKWFTAAAEHNIPEMQYDVAQKYYVGKDGVAQDYAKAFGLFQKAAEAVFTRQGEHSLADSEYYFMLGELYSKGQGVRQNYAEALKWFTRAVDLGSGKAAYKIAEMHKNGQGVRKNAQNAIEWFTKAHDYYNNEAAFTIAQIYMNGDGVKQDINEAQKWFVVAVKNDNEAALQWLMDNPDKVTMKSIAELERILSVQPRDRDNLVQVKQLMYNMADAGNVEALQRIFALAGSGDVKARYTIAKMYFDGRNLPQNYVNAWVWSRLALDQSNVMGKGKVEAVLEEAIPQLMNDADTNMTDAEQAAAREDWRLLKLAFKQN